jgi:hypothetical protein
VLTQQRQFVSPAERAQQLCRADREIVAGPRLSWDGQTIETPSPRYVPALVARWKQAGGRFRRTNSLYDLWLLPASRITLEEAERLYRQHYAADVAACRRRLAAVGIRVRAEER